MEAAAHTSGWYLQSADSQLLVWFYMQLKAKRKKSQLSSLSMPLWAQVTLVVFFPILSPGGGFITVAAARVASTILLYLRVIKSATGITWWQTWTKTDDLHNKAWWDMKGHNLLITTGITPSYWFFFYRRVSHYFDSTAQTMTQLWSVTCLKCIFCIVFDLISNLISFYFRV